MIEIDFSKLANKHKARSDEETIWGYPTFESIKSNKVFTKSNEKIEMTTNTFSDENTQIHNTTDSIHANNSSGLNTTLNQDHIKLKQDEYDKIWEAIEALKFIESGEYNIKRIYKGKQI